MKHSATSLKTWTNCPRLFKAKYIDKIIPYKEHPAAARGIAIHKELEDAVRAGADPSCWTPEGLIAMLHNKRAHIEVEMALTREGKPTRYSSAKAWLRGKMDVLLLGAKALVIDWKTGKVRPDKVQADMYTAIVNQTYAMSVEFRLVYVDQKQVVPLTRDAGAFERVKALAEQVEADSDFLPNPGWLCRYCDFTACRYNEAD
jgi:CRISPR/Cas system-associated exonuclease Cas4 (RecB family)